MGDRPRHRSVLLTHAVQGLNPVAGGVYLDATFGGGGHTRALLELTGPDGRVHACDRDPDALARGQGLQEEFPGRLTLMDTPFGQLQEALAAHGVTRINGALFDLGVSSDHLDRAERGFSFMRDGPLDMRMDPRQGPTAADLLNTLPERELADILFTLGEERHSRRIARAVVADRVRTPFVTTRQLAGLMERIVPRERDGHHPATRSFQALRIAVNNELDELKQGLEQAMALLMPGGRIVVISFHSLEDRIVKHAFRAAAHPVYHRAVMPPPPEWRVITTKPVMPDAREVADNPRARSARMRILERLPREGRG